ncbi:hypothetical protein [Candidatus Palauibacter sp.]|uniref:hypothetical protein n=1 Tax=Candidatus Palauibacter sp. TaxID=3101350 RepID=UPI003B0164A5
MTKGQIRMHFSERFRTLLACVFAAGGLAGCSAYRSTDSGMGPAPAGASPAMIGLRANPPTPDPRVGLAPGLFDAGEAAWNLRLVSATPPTEPFVGKTNSDLAFTGPYAIQGNYDGSRSGTSPTRPIPSP